MKKVIFSIIGIIALVLALFYFQEGGLTAQAVGTKNLCGNGLLDENETCGNCLKDAAVEEACDALDNDCDFVIDESGACNDELNCGAFEKACPKGDPCYFGVCGKPLVLLRFNDKSGTLASDSSGNGNSGTVMKLGKWITNPSQCVAGGCLSLGGSSDYVNFTAKPVSALFGDQFTISFWAKAENPPSRPTFGFLGSSFTDYNNPIVSYKEDMKVCNATLKTKKCQSFKYYLPGAPKSRWRHYAFVDNGVNYLVYVDGKEDHKENITINPDSIKAKEFVIGQSGFVEKGRADNYNGLIDEFFIYNRSLSPEEIKAIYNSQQS